MERGENMELGRDSDTGGQVLTVSALLLSFEHPLLYLSVPN